MKLAADNQNTNYCGFNKISICFSHVTNEMGRYLLMFAGWLKNIKAKFSVNLLAFLLFFVALVSTSTFSGTKEKAKRAKMAHVY